MSELLGTRLRKIRKTRNLTIQQVYEKTGIPSTHLSRLETGRTKTTSVHKVFALSKLYGVTMEYLIGEKNLGIEDIDRDFLRVYHLLGDEEKALVRRIVKRLARY